MTASPAKTQIPASTHGEPEAVLTAGLLEIQAQVLQVLEAVPDVTYQQTGPEPHTASIGSHIRHLIEFIQLLSKNQPQVFYDNRPRNPEIETNRTTARQALTTAAQALTDLLQTQGAAAPREVAEAITRQHAAIPLPSSLGREVVHVIQHATHHLALIKQLAHARGVALEPQIGIAVATQIFQDNGPTKS